LRNHALPLSHNDWQKKSFSLVSFSVKPIAVAGSIKYQDKQQSLYFQIKYAAPAPTPATAPLLIGLLTVGFLGLSSRGKAEKTFCALK